MPSHPGLTPEQAEKVRAKYGMSADVMARSLGQQTVIERTAQKDQIALNRKLEIVPSTDEEKLNQTERDYLAWLRAMRPQWYGVQCMTLKIGHDCRYTPDFWALDEAGLRAIDTKACHKGKTKPHIEDDALVKIKVAARLFPWIHFVIAWRREGAWEHRPIKP